MKTMYLMLLLPLLIISCAKEKATQINNNQLKPITLNTEQQALVQANNQFSFSLFSNSANQETKENLIISPFSVSMALSMTLNGAAGTTKTGMEKTLGFEGKQAASINDYNKLLSTQLQGIDEKVTFNVANSIWYRNNFTVIPSFISTNQNYYQAEVTSLDFASLSAVNTINNWVNTKTNSAIPKIIESISPDNVMFLINALYFKGSWRNKFDGTKTSDQSFYKEDLSVVKCKMMSQESTYRCLSNDLVSAIEMPYGQGNFVMTVLLPQTGKTTSDLTAAFNAANWKKWNDGMVSNKIQVYLPRFKINYENKLNSLLSTMGMADAFNPAVADFTRINAGGGLSISEVKHKTMVEVNEEGTVAAAVTSVAIVLNSFPQTQIININKPFLFVISEKSTGAILFTGRIMDPTKE
ncbi:MAG: serpin family protein [Bacteroidetes bacterium]|nr:serpin family protein [Bacteroidota bacterium]